MRFMKCISNHKNPISIDKDGGPKSICQEILHKKRYNAFADTWSSGSIELIGTDFFSSILSH